MKTLRHPIIYSLSARDKAAIVREFYGLADAMTNDAASRVSLNKSAARARVRMARLVARHSDPHSAAYVRNLVKALQYLADADQSAPQSFLTDSTGAAHECFVSK